MAGRIMRLLSSAPNSPTPLCRLLGVIAPAPSVSPHVDADHLAQEPCQPCSTTNTHRGLSHATHQTQLMGWAASGMQVSNSRRSLTSSSCAAHGGGGKHENEESISVTFVEKDGKETTVRAHLGENLLQVAHENEIDLEGACEGSLACSTCHLIVEDEDHFKRMPEASEDELDMLDLAYGLTETSRLGCQIIAAKELDGLRVRIPSASRNFYVDGHKPKPH